MSARPQPMFLPVEDWMQQANCRGKDTNIFYPPDGHNLLPRPAQEICNFCPVQMDCLEYALAHRIDDGVWGGTTRNQRRRILRARRTLRLAKEPEAETWLGEYG